MGYLADIGIKIGADLLEHGGIELASHVAEEEGERVVEDEVEHAAESCGGLIFSSSTLVTTSVGAKAIGTLKVGQKVWSYNPKTKKMEWEPVQHVWIDHDHDLVDLTIGWTKHTKNGDVHEDETIHTNKKHPFLTVEAGFVTVANLHVGMHLVQGDGQVGVIEDWVVIAGSETMYNLTVQQDHTYTVGDGQFVVHNTGLCDPSQIENPEARKAAQSVTNAFNDHLTDSDLSGAWRDAHGDPVPKPGGGFYDHAGEVENALQSGRKATTTFRRLLESGTLSESDQCIVQCMLSRTSTTMDYVENVISRDQWFPGTTVQPFP